MEKNVILTIRGQQFYEGQEPDVIELVTEGTMVKKDADLWVISYEESDLTGLEGTKTTFRIEPGAIRLGRSGGTRSYMVFQEGVPHESLYEIAGGALMMSVCANKIQWELSETGGFIHVLYAVVIEQSLKGNVDYQIQVKVK